MIYYAMFDEDFDFGIMSGEQFLSFAKSRSYFKGLEIYK